MMKRKLHKVSRRKIGDVELSIANNKVILVNGIPIVAANEARRNGFIWAIIGLLYGLFAGWIGHWFYVKHFTIPPILH